MEFEITMEDLRRGHKFRFTTGQDKETWYEYRGGREFLPVSQWREKSRSYDYYAKANKRFKRDRKCAITIDEDNPTATFGPEKLWYLELAKNLKTLNGKIDEEIQALECRWKDSGILDFKYTLASASENHSTSYHESRERKFYFLLWGDIPANVRSDYGYRNENQNYPYVIAKLKKTLDLDNLKEGVSTITVFSEDSTMTDWRNYNDDTEPTYVLPLYGANSDTSNTVYFAMETVLRELFKSRAKACEEHYTRLKYIKDRKESEKENSL